MGRVVHFEIHADNPERAVKFYGEMFGWNFTRWGGPIEYWMIKTGSGDGIDGGLIRRQGSAPEAGQPMNGFVCTVDVTQLDSQIEQATRLGAEVVVPKMPIPGVGWLVYIRDTEGNIVGMMQTDPSVGLGSSGAAV